MESTHNLAKNPNYNIGSKIEELERSPTYNQYNQLAQTYQNQLKEMGIKTIKYINNGKECLRFSEILEGAGHRFISKKNVERLLSSLYTINQPNASYQEVEKARKLFFNRVSPSLENKIEDTYLRQIDIPNKPKLGLKPITEKKVKKKYSPEAKQRSLDLKNYVNTQKKLEYQQVMEEYQESLHQNTYYALELAERRLNDEEVEKANNLIKRKEKIYDFALKVRKKTAITLGADYLPEKMFAKAVDNGLNINELVEKLFLKRENNYKKGRIDEMLNNFMKQTTFIGHYALDKIDENYLLARIQIANNSGYDKEKIAAEKLRLQEYRKNLEQETSPEIVREAATNHFTFKTKTKKVGLLEKLTNFFRPRKIKLKTC
jgi:hypothetical protein